MHLGREEEPPGRDLNVFLEIVEVFARFERVYEKIVGEVFLCTIQDKFSV